MHRSQLLQHPRAARGVECPGQHLVSISEELEHIEVPLMVTTRRIRRDAIKFIENAFAIPLESRLPDFPENLPV